MVFDFSYCTVLNFLAVITYMVFVFIIIVLYLNILIAQLTDTYGAVKINAEKLVASYRMNFVYQIQKKSILSLVKDKSDDENTEENDKLIVKEHEFKKYFLVGEYNLFTKRYAVETLNKSLCLLDSIYSKFFVYLWHAPLKIDW